LEVYGKSFNVSELQNCLYGLYDPEIEAIKSILLANELKNKNFNKAVEKISRSFLLDNLELNSKTRCIIAWSGEKSLYLSENILLFILEFLYNRSIILWVSTTR
jgi:hypothetical protein